MDSTLTNIGDDEIVRVWDVPSKKQKQLLEDHGRRWGQITCLAWLESIKDALTLLSFGTGCGLVVIYRQTKENVSITHLMRINIK